MSGLILPPQPVSSTTRGCPLGWFGMALPGRQFAGTQEIQVQNLMPPCQEEKCMFWRIVSQGIVGGENEHEELEYDCAIARACETVYAGSLS